MSATDKPLAAQQATEALARLEEMADLEYRNAHEDAALVRAALAAQTEPEPTLGMEADFADHLQHALDAAADGDLIRPKLTRKEALSLLAVLRAGPVGEQREASAVERIYDEEGLPNDRDGLAAWYRMYHASYLDMLGKVWYLLGKHGLYEDGVYCFPDGESFEQHDAPEPLQGQPEAAGEPERRSRP